MKKGQKIIFDIVGKKYGRLTILEFMFVKNRRSNWKCQCECGNIVIKDRKQLCEPRINHSCGCVARSNGGPSRKRNEKEALEFKWNCIKNMSHWEGDCLIWEGYMQKDTTPVMSLPNKSKTAVRKWIYTQSGKMLPKGYNVYKTCDNYKCINIKHMGISKNGRDIK